MYALEATFSVRNLITMFVLMKSQMCLKMGQVRSKNRSVDQILEKPCVRSRGHIFHQKLGQNVCLDKILDAFENRLCRVKNLVASQNLEKPCVHFKGHIFSPIIMKRGQDVCLNEISYKFGNGSCRV